mgnify:CR=1 FL=1
MKDNKIKTISNLFENKEIRSIWDREKEEYYFSVVDVIGVLTDHDYNKSRNYWKWLKSKLKDEGSELVSNTNQLKMKAQDGKLRQTDTLDTEGIFRLIESIPSPKAEPFKLWFAKLGRQKVDEVFDPSKGIDEMIDLYLKKGYSLEWIEARLKAIINRKKLTEVWNNNGIKEGKEFAILTNAIYKEWSGMNAKEYKEYKGIRKENLRDNMSRIEVIIADLGEAATEELAKKHKPLGLEENKKIAKLGGHAAKSAKEDLEKNLGESIITPNNNLAYKYIDESKKIENK